MGSSEENQLVYFIHKARLMKRASWAAEVSLEAGRKAVEYLETLRGQREECTTASSWGVAGERSVIFSVGCCACLQSH